MESTVAEVRGSAATKREPALVQRRILDPKWDGRTTFTVPEAGEIVGLSRCGAYAAAKAGHLPVVWIGRRAIVPRHALERLLDV